MEIRDAKGLTEAEFLEIYKSKNYKRPYLTADVIVFDKDNRILLIRRKGHPFIGRYAFPGGFAEENENIEQSARRELLEETGVTDADVVPVGLYSEPGRDPRGWVVSQLFYAQLKTDVKVAAGDDAADAKWFKIVRDCDKVNLVCDTEQISIDDLAFDHAKMLRDVLRLVSI